MAKKTAKKHHKGDHLKPYDFKPGESGNPNGRPLGSISLVSKLKKQLREHPEDADKIVDKWITDAKEGDDKARTSIIDRMEGKVPDMTIIVQKIQIDVVQHIGAMLPQAMLQAGVPKKQVNEALTNFNRLLEAGE
jgi:hypothetical protein